MSKRAILIPIYEPDESSLVFLSKFKPEDFDSFLVIDDGSGERFAHIFKAIGETTPFQVIGYPENKGKGYALKYGFKLLLEKDPDLTTIITADGDGQHAYEDILRVRECAAENEDAIIMGNRAFEKKKVPLASQIGHAFASLSFRTVSKQKIPDVQTGLRAIPAPLFQLALDTPGNRYDYEHDFLLEAAKTSRIVVIDIKAIYIDNNRGSHFHPVTDTIIIYKYVLLAFFAFLSSWAFDLGLFYVFSTLVFYQNLEAQVFLSSLLSRIASGSFHFLILFLFVFDERFGHGGKILKFGISFLIGLVLSSTLIYAFAHTQIPLTLAKFIVDAAILVLNLVGTRIIVYALNRSGKRRKSDK